MTKGILVNRLEIISWCFYALLSSSNWRINSSNAAGLGFEPRLMDSESMGLPLADPASTEKIIARKITPVYARKTGGQ